MSICAKCKHVRDNSSSDYGWWTCAANVIHAEKLHPITGIKLARTLGCCVEYNSNGECQQFQERI